MRIAYGLHPADWIEVARRLRRASAQARWRRTVLLYLLLSLVYVGALWQVRPRPGQDPSAWWFVAATGLLPLMMLAIGQTEWFALRVLRRRLERSGRAKRLHYELTLDDQGVQVVQGLRRQSFAWTEVRAVWKDDRFVYLGRGPQNVWIIPLRDLDADEARDLLDTAQHLREQAAPPKGEQ